MFESVAVAGPTTPPWFKTTVLPAICSSTSAARQGASRASRCLCFAAAAASGQTLGTRRPFGEYQQFVWTDQHGLPQNSVSAITRTRDGYLWLATYEGLVRFDGVRFAVFDTSNTAAITIGLTRTLVEDRTGALWIGFDGGGLVRYANGRFEQYTKRSGLTDDHVFALRRDVRSASSVRGYGRV